ncbi:guanylate kinase [Proteiniclasticum sp. C24MP]|uniref:guanylate kinase n=1 Tax=Proteiniclasticum sp. C24MP TaxID=3374101 RepID=UPI0037544F98
MSRGLLLVISGPSGAGKGTVCDAYKKHCENFIWNSVSMTTRAPRAGEVEGESYYFVSREEFQKMIENDEFLEYAEVYGNYYGTPRAEVERKLSEGTDVILEIDIQGALNVQENTTEGIFIFILPPSMNELRNRIIGRGSETPESLLTRFKSAYNEINYVNKYNYAITNHTVEQAYQDLICIVRAEKCRVTRVSNEILTLKEEKL